MKKGLVALGVAAAGVLLVWLVWTGGGPENRDSGSPPSGNAAIETVSPAGMPKRSAAGSAPRGDVAADASESEESQESKTPEELREEAEEAAVDSFDALTDKWMEPSPKGATMADVDAFVREFAKVPSDRREECLQRALNLIPDENVMLLAGVLMDKSQPKELVELVFNDLLNRDEDVKNPILVEILKDKTHPCWADANWILDATGETAGGLK